MTQCSRALTALEDRGLIPSVQVGQITPTCSSSSGVVVCLFLTTVVHTHSHGHASKYTYT